MARWSGFRGAWRVSVLVLVAVFGLSGATAAARHFKRTSRALSGDPLHFDGGDGNQANGTGFDWEGLLGLPTVKVNHKADCPLGVNSPCPKPVADDIFVGGDKEFDPGGWGITTEPGGGYSNPAKANILDAYWAFQHQTNFHAFLYLAFTREMSGGDTFITFELNQDPRMWNNGHSEIPCRTTGDIMVSFEPQSSSNMDDFQVNEWITGAVDPVSGCATTGAFEIPSLPISSANFEAAFNPAPILPAGQFLPPTSGTPIATGDFGEASIDLSNLLGGDQDGCSRFASIWMYSQSSTSSTNPQMKDYVAPTPSLIRTCKASPILTTTVSGSVNRKARGKHRRRRHAKIGASITDTAVLAGGDNPTGTITFKLYGPHGCTGGPIFTSIKPVDGNGSYTSDPFPPQDLGTYSWTAEYSGDANNEGYGPTDCGIDPETVQIQPPPDPAQPTITTVASPATVLGSPINDTATLADTLAPVSGTITFKVYGPFAAGAPVACTGATAAPPSTVTVNRGNGPYTSASFTPTVAGTYEWLAEYASGDTTINKDAASTCGVTGESVLVSPTPPPVTPGITSTASSGGPLGSPIHDTAHLSGGSHPTGTITFRIFGPNTATCSTPAAPPSTVAVSGAGDYQSASFTPTAAGTYRWVATYSGDANNATAATACADPAETAVISPARPGLRTSASPVTVRAGGAVGDTATLSAGANPQGTITFRLYGPNDSACSLPPAVVVEQTVNGNGSYRSPTPTPSVPGTYRWVATYSGDSNNAGVATGCGDSGETVTVRPVRAVASADENAKPKPKPKPKPHKPTFTG